MKLSALEIKSQEFKRTLRGLDEAEVQSFLDMVASQWQEVQEDLRRNEERVRELENKIVHYQKIEEALQEALTSAKASSKATVAEAERKAELVVREAEIRARALSREAEGQVRQMHDTATAIGRRRKQMVARLRAFLNAELELLTEYAEDQNRDQIPPLPEHLQMSADDPVQNAYEAAMHRRPNGGAAASSVRNNSLDSRPSPVVQQHSSADPDEYANAANAAEHEAGFAYDGHDEDVSDLGRDSAGHVNEPDDAIEAQRDHADAEHEYDHGSESDYGSGHAEGEPYERGPVEHQRHAPPESSFEGEADAEPSAEDDDDISPENTEWRIRRILDNLE